MTAYQVYEQAIKPLSAEEKLAIARLIMDEVVPNPAPESNGRQSEKAALFPSQFAAGHHLLEGVDIEALLATPIDDMFADYMPSDAEESKR